MSSRTSGAPEPAGRTEAEQIFLSQLGEASSAGELDIDALCERHPAEADALRALHANWGRMSALLSRFGATIELPTRRASDDTRDWGALDERLERLARRPDDSPRYRVEAEIGRGGMGAVHRVWEEDLRRELAMKTLHPEAVDAASKGTLSRFLEEAQITGQLEHPGIVPVHELGIDARGGVYFTMKLVRGDDLHTILDRCEHGDPDWNRTRILNVLLRVCEAMAYAHSKGVVHRDLKPANVMVGDFGEVYVMDWGLASIALNASGTDAGVASDRAEWRAGDPASPVVTLDGTVLGTPGYMPPEQAAGNTAAIGPPADVYAVGAMLYHLLTGGIPYRQAAAAVPERQLLNEIVAGPPPPVARLGHDVPPELEAICERAMAREPSQRYASMLELAADLRAYLENRVVRAHRTGPVVELRKWIERNQLLAGALGLLFVSLAAGLVTGFVLYRQSEANAALASAKATEAEARAEQVLDLSTMVELDELFERARALWPAVPARRAELSTWLDDATRVAAKRADFEAKRAELGTDGGLAARQEAWWHERLTELIAALEQLDDPEHGPRRGLSPEFGPGVEQRLAFADAIEARSLTDDDVARRWADAIGAVADGPHYDGLELAPQLGLVPLGSDPTSGLEEFAQLATGTVPTRAPVSGALQLEEASGVVFVLIPAGSVTLGLQSDDPAAPRYDASAAGDLHPVHTVALAAFFLAKHELTQAQWMRLARDNPSSYRPDNGTALSLLHPVEQVSWQACVEVLARADLTLPTEAQWEYAARAGTRTRWWSGAERASLAGTINIADETARDAKARWPAIGDWPGFRDGFAAHAPVDTYRANPFGLQSVLGNVREWCLDAYLGYSRDVRADDGLRLGDDSGQRVWRGASYFDTAGAADASLRQKNTPTHSSNLIGVRPARAVRD